MNWDDENEDGILRSEDDASLGQPKSAMNPQVRDYLLKKQEVGPPKSAMMPPKEKSLSDQYADMAADNSAIDSEQKKANAHNTIGNIFGSLGKMFGNDSMDQINKNAADRNAKVGQLRKDKQGRMDDLLTRDKLQYQDVERGRAADKDARGKVEDGQHDTDFGNKQEKFGWDAVDNKPGTPAALAAASVVGKKMGVDPKSLAGLSYNQIKDISGKSSGDPAKFQQAVLDIAGKSTQGTFNPNTGAFEPAQYLKGYAQKVDLKTGLTTSASNPGAVRTLKTDDGRDVADVVTGLTEQRAHASETGKQQAKDEQASQVADVEVTSTREFQDKIKGWRNQAKSEGPLGDNTGVVSGRAAAGLTDLGFDLGPGTTRFVKDMNREGQRYVVKMTGLTSTDPQYNRLMNNMPKLGEQDGSFESSMASWFADVQRIADEKKRLANGGRSVPAAPAAAPAEMKRKTKDGRTAVFDAQKNFLRYED